MTLIKRLFSLVLVIAIIGNLGWVLPLSAFAESLELLNEIKGARKVDICFVLDSTGSMSSYIDSVVQNLSVFIDRLTESNIDVKMSLIDFKDITADSTPFTVHTFLNGHNVKNQSYWTSSESAMKDAIKSVSIYGGGDTDETPTNALIEYPEGRIDASKFVFLLTDADYKDTNTITSIINTVVDAFDNDKDNNVISMNRVVEKYKDEKISASVVSKKFYEEHYKKLYGQTNGIFIDIDTVDYSDLMLSIADWIEESTLQLIHGEFEYSGFSSTKDNIADYYYSDAYFYEDSTYYNNHLATMSLNLCFSMTSTSADNEENKGKGIKPITEIGKGNKVEEWKDRTTSIQKLFKEIGFDDFAMNSFMYNEPETDSIGAVIANKKLQVKTTTGETETCTLIALVVRGFGYFSEWGGNFRVGDKLNHVGFESCARNVLDFLKEYIVKHEIKGRIKLWITGYSRAGATTNMVAGFLDTGMKDGVFIGDNNKDLPAGVTLSHKELYAYAFEPPMGIDRNMHYRGDYSNIHNIVNVYDPVPKVAMKDWDFTRFNKNGSEDSAGGPNHTLPNLSSEGYDDAKNNMLNQFSILQSNPIDLNTDKEYKVSEYPYSFQIVLYYTSPEYVSMAPDSELVRTDYWGGKVILDIANRMAYNIDEYIDSCSSIDIDIGIKEDKSQTIDKFLDKVLNDGVVAAIGDRSAYKDNFQNAVINVLGDLGSVRYEMDFCAYAKNLLELLNDCFNDHEFLMYVYYPTVLSLAPNELKPIVIARIYEVIKKQISSNPGKYKDQDHLLTLAEKIIPLIAELFIHDPELFCSTIFTFLNSNVFDAHQGYVTLAWLRSQDSYYTESPVNTYFPNILRILRTNCPVDVVVYDSKGEKVAEISSKNPISYGYIGCDINENDEMVITLPADESYRAEILPTDNGEMSFSVDEYNMLYGDYTRILNYYDVAIDKDNKLYADIPALPESEYADYHKASSVKYKLTRNNGEVISPSQEITSATDVGQYHIDVSANNTGGVVTGGGSFVSGSFCKVKASPFLKDGFLGWYEGDKLVSKELEYRFPVTGDRKLVAKFVAPKMSKLTVKSTEGGFIFDWTGEYPVGLVLPLHAEPDKGYKFKGWSVNDGTIVANSAVEDLDFIVPETETTLTAIFVDENAEEYKFTSGTGSRWVKKSKDTLIFTVNGNIDAFDSILIDNNKINSNSFTVSGPTITIQLKPSLLETLSVGEHTITAKMKDGDCTTYFFIVDAIPHTGDDGHIVEWGVVGISMALLLVLIAVKAKKKQHVA